MAEVNIPALFDRLGEQMLGLSQTIKSQGVTLDVTPFDGKAKDFKNWMKAVEKHARLNQLNEDQTKLVAYKTSRGAVSDYLDRVLNEHPGYEWERIKNELSSRFAEISDAQHAFTLLHKIKQKHEENIPVFAERLLSLANQAYSDDSLRTAEVQKQLVNFFIDGLSYDYIKIKVMRENSETLQDAVTTAMNEFNFRKRVDLRTGHDYYSRSNFDSRQEEPMDVSHYRPKQKFKQKFKKCEICGRTNHPTNSCRNRAVDAVAPNTSASHANTNNNDRQQPHDTRYYHYARQPPSSRRRTDDPFRTTDICYNCGQPGHYMRDCRANWRSGN